MRKVLFIGSGKSYRSKFAEAFFNNRGKLECLFMLNTHGMGRYPSSRYPHAYSSGIDRKKPTKKLNKVSVFACEKDNNLMYGSDCYEHFHRNLTEKDFAHCDYIVAMNESKLKKYLDKHFSDFSDKIEYWDIPKKKKVSDKVVELLKQKVNELYDIASQKGKKHKKDDVKK
jgi:protein-tyrosine-phosphatase